MQEVNRSFPRDAALSSAAARRRPPPTDLSPSDHRPQVDLRQPNEPRPLSGHPPRLMRPFAQLILTMALLLGLLVSYGTHVALASSTPNPIAATDYYTSPVEPALTGSIGNYVWHDTNGDGRQNEPPDKGVNDVTVFLLDSNGAIIDEAITANNLQGEPGYYRFEELIIDDAYMVEFTLPQGYTFTVPNAVDPQMQPVDSEDPWDSDANPGTGRSHLQPLRQLLGGDCIHCSNVDAGLVLEGSTGGGTGEEVTLFVAPYKTICTGLVLRKCLLTREDQSEAWGNFYDGIHGFVYEPGYEYELLVLREPVPNPPADGSSVRWTLLEEISKTLALSPDGDGDFDGVDDVTEDLNGDGDPYNDDTDSDGIPDFIDGDDDNDGMRTGPNPLDPFGPGPSAQSAQVVGNEDRNGNGDPTDDDSDGDGIPDYLDADDMGPGPGDSDDDGMPDNVECASGIPCPDSDGNGTPDYMQNDAPLPEGDLHVEKTRLGPEVVQIGMPVPFMIEVTNMSASEMMTVTLDDDYDSDCLVFMHASLPMHDGTSPGGTMPPNPSGTSMSGPLHWDNIGPLPPGDTILIFVEFMAHIHRDDQGIARVCDPALNHAEAEGFDASGMRLGMDMDSDHVVIEGEPPMEAELEVEKRLLTPEHVQEGDLVAFAIHVTNVGAVPLATVTLEDEYPSHCLMLLHTSMPPDEIIQAAAGAGILRWDNVGPLAPGQSSDIFVEFAAAVATDAQGTLAHCRQATNHAMAEGFEQGSVGTSPIADDTDDAHVSIANPETGVIGDYVWLDHDGDGLQNEPPAGLNGIDVNLYQIMTTGDAALIDSTTTDFGPHGLPGYYLFTDLPIPGTYEVEFVLPDGLAFTLPDQDPVPFIDTESPIDSDADPASGRTGPIHLHPLLPAGAQRLSVDAGVIETNAAALDVTKTRLSPAVVANGDPVSFALNVTNVGATDLMTITMHDRFSANCLTFQNASMTPDFVQIGTFGPAQVGWHNVGPLAVNASKTITVNFTAQPIVGPFGQPVDCSNVVNRVGVEGVDITGTPVNRVGDQAQVSISDGQIITLYVGPYRDRCDANSPQHCLQVRSNPADPWQSTRNRIAGFEHQLGYEFELLVLEEARPQEVPSVIASAIVSDVVSDVRWTLLEIVNQTYVGDDDTDNDGTPDVHEGIGPHEGDANGDGTPDYQQGNVATEIDGSGESYITLEAEGDCTAVTNMDTIDEDSFGQGNGNRPDEEFRFPFGLVSYTLQCNNPGDSATVDYYLHGAQDMLNLVFRKFVPAAVSLTDPTSADWFDFPATFERVMITTPTGETVPVIKATVTLTDGAFGDADGLENGIIVDPGGVAQDSSVAINTTLNTAEPVIPGQPVSFTVVITNTGNTVITSLPMTDTYNNTYLAFDSARGATPAADDNANDGVIHWTDLLTGTAGLPISESITVTINFIARAETTNAAAETPCIAAGQTCNVTAIPGVTGYDDVQIDRGPSKYKIGDFIWHDIDNDGLGPHTGDTNEAGINGVLVNLYRDSGTTPGLVDGGDTLLMTTTTAISNTVSGFYEFDEGITGENYVVEIAASNFALGGPLEGFVIAANQGSITGTTNGSQFIANIQSDRLDIDFGLYCRFDLALIKQTGAGQPTSIAPGDDVTFTITVYNQGIVTATNVVVADYIPTGFTLSPASVGTWHGGPTGIVTTTLAATLTPSGTAGVTATVDIVLTAGATLRGTFTNTAEIADYTSAVQDVNGADLPDADSTPDMTDGNGTNGNGGESGDLEDDQTAEDGTLGGQDEDDHDIAPITVVGIFDLALRKSLVGPAVIGPGEDVTFTVEIFNQGTITAANLVVADYIPTGFSLSLNDGNGWTPAGGTGTVTNTIAGTLTPSGTVGSSTSVNIQLTAGTNIISGTYENKAEIASVTDVSGTPVTDVDSTPDTTDGNGSNGNGGESGDLEDDQLAEDGKTPGQDEDDHDLAPVLVQTTFDLALIKVTDAVNVRVGDMVTFTLYVQNQGNIDASNVEVCDWVPAGFVAPNAANNPDPNWNFLAPYPIYTIPNLDAGQTVSFTLVMEVDTDAANGNLTNQAGIRQADRADDPTPAGTDTRVDEDGTFTGPSTTPPYAPPFPTGVIDQLNPSDIDVDLVPGDDDDHDIATVLLAGTPALQVVKTLNGTNPFSVNEPISFNIVITNTGDVTITVLPLEDLYNNIFIQYVAASVTPSVTNPGLLVWNDLTTALGDVAPTESISLNVTFTTLADTTLLTPVAPCTSNGHTPNIVEVANAFADPDGDDGNTNDDVAVIQDVDDDDCAEVQILNPTAVQLADHSISQTANGVQMRWSTINESDIVSFNIWQSSGAVANLRNSEPIIAERAGQSSGASYEWLDAGATLNRDDVYVLEIVKSNGTSERAVINVMRGGDIFLPLVAK